MITLCTSQDYLMDPASAKEMLPKRSNHSHKGTYGSGLIVAGSSRYIGAASLAAEAAYRSGSGIVSVATTQAVIHALAGINREATWISLPDESGDLAESASDRIIDQIQRYDALLIGPGIGLAETTRLMISSILRQINTPIPLVIDADGLNLLASIPDWHKLLPADTILTPHPGEMARLTGLHTQDIQRNRWEIARHKAQEWNTIIVLKGAQTVVAMPNGKLAVAPFQTDALATAGTGDILAGIITGLLAQGQTAVQAAMLGVYVHGLAGLSAEREKNTRSIIASDLLKHISQAFEVLEN
jgi:NAD(P)H-hydrate epimerase